LPVTAGTGAVSVTYALAGYKTQTVQVDVVPPAIAGESPRLDPNPAMVELEQAPPPVKRRGAAARKRSAPPAAAAAATTEAKPKPATRKRPVTVKRASPALPPAPAEAAPAPAPAAPPPPAAAAPASPWPDTPPPPPGTTPQQ
jgi:hypothetical protein